MIAISIIFSWLISLSIAVFAYGLAEFGGTPWIFVLCGIWLVSVGLPTTLSIIFLAAIWGHFPVIGTPSLMVFAACAAVLSLIAQATFYSGAFRLIRRWRSR